MLVTIDPSQWLNLAINVFLPALVALVTARAAHPGVKAVTLMFLSAVSGFLTYWLDATTNHELFQWQQAAFTVLSGFAVAVLSHVGVLEPFGVTGAGGAIQRAVPKGIGRKAS
jgi:hypothetical protein